MRIPVKRACLERPIKAHYLLEAMRLATTGESGPKRVASMFHDTDRGVIEVQRHEPDTELIAVPTIRFQHWEYDSTAAPAQVAKGKDAKPAA